MFCDHCNRMISKSAYYRHKRYRYDDIYDDIKLNDSTTSDSSDCSEHSESEDMIDQYEQPSAHPAFDQVSKLVRPALTSLAWQI